MSDLQARVNDLVHSRYPLLRRDHGGSYTDLSNWSHRALFPELAGHSWDIAYKLMSSRSLLAPTSTSVYFGESDSTNELRHARLSVFESEKPTLILPESEDLEHTPVSLLPHLHLVQYYVAFEFGDQKIPLGQIYSVQLADFKQPTIISSPKNNQTASDHDSSVVHAQRRYDSITHGRGYIVHPRPSIIAPSGHD